MKISESHIKNDRQHTIFRFEWWGTEIWIAHTDVLSLFLSLSLFLIYISASLTTQCLSSFIYPLNADTSNIQIMCCRNKFVLTLYKTNQSSLNSESIPPKWNRRTLEWRGRKSSIGFHRTQWLEFLFIQINKKKNMTYDVYARKWKRMKGSCEAKNDCLMPNDSQSTSISSSLRYIRLYLPIGLNDTIVYIYFLRSTTFGTNKT